MDGTLNAYGSTFSASGTSWDGIYFAQGSSGSLSSVTVQNVQAYGGGAIYAYKSAPSFVNSQIENCFGACSGVYVYWDSPNFRGNTISGNSLHGIALSNSSSQLVENTITGNTSTGNAAVWTTYYASPLFAYPTSQNNWNEGRNTAQGGCYGIYATNNASPDFGCCSDLANKNRLVNNTYDAYAASDADISANYVWWGEYLPNTGQIVGPVSYDNPLQSDPAGSSKAGGMATASGTSSQDGLKRAIRFRHQKQYAQAVPILESLLASSSDLAVMKRALTEVMHIFKATEDDRLLSLIDSHTRAGGGLQPIAMELLLAARAHVVDVEAALEVSDRLQSEFPGTSYEKNARQIETLLYFDAGQKADAANSLVALESDFGDDYQVQSIRRLFYLEGLVDNPLPGEGSASVATSSGGHASTYPNPFNPATTIAYRLEGESQVVIKVYDTLGRLIRTLAVGTQPQGHHKVRFDASNLSTGVYLYRIDTSDWSETGTMLLAK